MRPISKSEQLNYKNKKPKKEGSKTESPVQDFIDEYLKILSLDNFRVPDSFWRYIHNPYNKIKIHIKAMCSKAFSGWCDNMVFEVLNDKYLIAMPLEAKSKTGKLNGNKQRNMAKRLNYQIPRSPEQAKEMIDTFVKDAEMYREILKKKDN